MATKKKQCHVCNDMIKTADSVVHKECYLDEIAADRNVVDAVEDQRIIYDPFDRLLHELRLRYLPNYKD